MHIAEALLNHGSTPLHFACAHNHVPVVRLLLAHGAAPHIPDKRGVTPVDLLPPTSPEPGSGSSDTLSIRAVIREYYELEKAKEKDFQKNHSSGQMRFHGKAAAVLGFPREDEGSRIGVKHSLENLLSKSPKHIPAPLRGVPAANGIGTPPAERVPLSRYACDMKQVLERMACTYSRGNIQESRTSIKTAFSSDLLPPFFQTSSTSPRPKARCSARSLVA